MLILIGIIYLDVDHPCEPFYKQIQRDLLVKTGAETPQKQENATL